MEIVEGVQNLMQKPKRMLEEAMKTSASVKNIIETEKPHFDDAVVDRGAGVYLWTEEGKKYLDFTSQQWTLNCGHANPRIQEAVKKQLDKGSQLQPQVMAHRPILQLMDSLMEILPRDLNQFGFFVTGAEVVENAIKIAKAYTGRNNIIAFNGAYHGRTMGAMQLSTSRVGSRKGFTEIMAGVHVAPYGWCHDCATDQCSGHRDPIDALRDLMKHETAPTDVAAMIVEPVQGDGGQNPASKEFLRGLREVCDEHGIVLILDEIMCGFGRTGKWFGFEHAGIVPDMTGDLCVRSSYYLQVMAKGLANGYPLSVVAMKHAIGTSKKVEGSIGSTYSGSVIGCVAANEVISILREEKVMENCAARGEQLLKALSRLKQDSSYKIVDVRGQGLMVAVEFADVPEDFATKVVQEAYKLGLMLAGTSAYEAVAFAPPLIVTAEQCDEAVRIFEKALKNAL